MIDYQTMRMRLLHSLIVLLAGTLLFACAGKKSGTGNNFFEEWKIKAETSKGHSPSAHRTIREIGGPAEEPPGPVPKDHGEAAAEQQPDEPPPKTSAPPRSFPVEPVSMRMHNAPLSVLLKALARAADQNIMISPKVQGNASLNITKAPWDQVFLGVLKTYGLSYLWEGDIIRIISLQDITHELQLLDAEQKISNRKREEELKRLEAVEKKQTQERKVELAAPLLTRIIPVSYADAAGLKKNLEQFLPSMGEKGRRGSVIVDEHTRSLVVQATRKDIDRIAALVEVLDRPTPQIRIEAHIVETSQDIARELGIQWGGIHNKRTGEDQIWITPDASDAIGNSLSEDGVDPNSGMAVNFPAALGIEDIYGMNIGAVVEEIGNSILAVQLSALQEDGALNILSSPSITTLDNQSATIESGKEVPFQTVEDGEVNIVFKKAVLSLKVTPHVIDPKTLKLNIVTNKDELDFSNEVQGNPTIITKKAETNVVLYDGQTTVIGGLSKETSSETESGVPYLKDIPGLGSLFRRKGNSNNMEEILIFITPYILKPRES